MNNNDFNVDSGRNPQGGPDTENSQSAQDGYDGQTPRTPADSQDSQKTIHEYGAPQFGQPNQNPSYFTNGAPQQATGTQNPGYSGMDFPGYGYRQPVEPSYQYTSANRQTQPGPAPYQYGANQQMQNSQPLDSMPPIGLQGYYIPAPNQKWNTLCIIGFILSFFMPIIGLALSVVALIQINHSGEKSKGVSVAGIAIGAVLTILDVILAIVLVSAFGSIVSHTDSDYPNCHGSDCSSNPFDDGDDPDAEDNEDTSYAYYLYDFGQAATTTDMDALPDIA